MVIGQIYEIGAFMSIVVAFCGLYGHFKKLLTLRKKIPSEIAVTLALGKTLNIF